MDKYIVPVELKIDTENDDADYLGALIVSAFKSLDKDTHVVNILKLDVGGMSAKAVVNLIGMMHETMQAMKLDNVVLIPVSHTSRNLPRDITVEHITLNGGK